MDNKIFDVVAIGNAIVDILAHVPEDFITKHALAHAGMTLIDEARAAQIYADMPPARECSGGSAANTLAGMAMLGSKGAFVGKVKDDQLGNVFRHDMRAIGIDFSTKVLPSEVSDETTARCYVAVTPDGERTMATYLGVAALIIPDDIDPAVIKASRLLYIEGYMWDRPNAIDTIRHAINIAKESDTQIALTLSDMFCVARHREAFLELVEQDLHILFANEAEIMGLFDTTVLEDALAQLKGKIHLGIITCGAQGAYVVAEDSIIHVSTEPVDSVTDATGAGDLFAAGFLHGYVQGKPHQECAALGNGCARQIIQQLGARAEDQLKQLVA